MAKKDRLASLVDGLTGINPVQVETPREPAGKLSPAEAEELDLTEEQLEKLNALRMSKRGRPKGRKTGEGHGREARATFIVDTALTRKLKYIALSETKLYKTVISEAIEEYIEKWESENGEISI